nr:PREDICTED: coiled-coil domain-containing protein 129 isoform X1 [Anolis carolinensis]|eukprot:XP_008111027.1 PREDICTED: coiled-coil domain-containing protein 129 isoform X1 [Anolis carolinensis]
MTSEYHYHGSHNTEKKKRERLLSTRKSWIQQDEDFCTAEVTLRKPSSIPHLVDRKEANLCSWMDSGFYLSAKKESQESRDKAAALSPPLGMVQMTVQNYMRSLHRFSEMPALSRWNSANSSHPLPSTPKSIVEWLDFSEKDPVEVLLDLGFGTDEPDICTKIPSRFISCASAAKGINIRVFIEAQRHRMDLENPNLCGRFRQLEVLDHVTSAFSSLLNDVSAMQQKPEDEKRDRTAVDSLKEKPVVTQTKRRRIGQLLRKASRQTTIHGPQVYRSAGPCKVKEDYCPAADIDLHIMTKTSLSDNTALVCLKEELLPSEESETAMTITQLAQSRASKTWALPHPAIKQSRLPSCSEMALKDRPHKESNLLLTHMLRRVSGFGGKPADSFEMEEIQSFEDEVSWGNPLESTSDMIVTRTNSCQSDSSGFLEDPSEPLPLQALSLPGNLRLSFNSHDGQSFLRYRKNSISTSQDLQSYAEGPNINTTAGSSYVALLPNLSREHTFQGEEIFYSISEEDDLCVTSGGQEESAVRETGHQIDEMEIQSRRRELEKGDVQECLVCHRSDSMNQVEIRSPEENCLSHGREVNSSIYIDGGQIEDIRREDDEALTEETDIKDISKGDVCLEGAAGGVAEMLKELKVCGKLDSPLPPTDVTSGCQDVDLRDQMITLDTANTFRINNDINTAQPELNVISRTLLPDDSFPPSCFGKEETDSLDKLPRSMELDEEGHVPCFEKNSNSPFKSVTVQMPSRLLSNMQSISLGETGVKSQSIDFTSKMSQCSKDDPLLTPISVASNAEDKRIKEVSIQTDKSTRNNETLPHIRCLPSFHRHGHLVKSTSLDTGLHGKYRSCCYEPSRSWCIQPRGHHCSLNSHHCCLMWPFPFVTSCNHPAACCSSNTTTELQLLKTLKLLQDTALRNISSSTVQEIEVMKNSCQKFRERLDEIELHMLEQEALFSTLMSKEGREERNRLQVLRQAVRREVAELECQLQDHMHQVREGILMNLDQLLGEQSNLCSELGIPGWREEKASNTPTDADTTASSRAKCSKNTCLKWTSSRSATFPSTPSTSSFRKDEQQASAFIAEKPSSASGSEEIHISKKESKAHSQPKLDFKTFIQNLKRSFRNSFSHDAAGGRV